jgi:hypothetical protein
MENNTMKIVAFTRPNPTKMLVMTTIVSLNPLLFLQGVYILTVSNAHQASSFEF